MKLGWVSCLSLGVMALVPSTAEEHKQTKQKSCLISFVFLAFSSINPAISWREKTSNPINQIKKKKKGIKIEGSKREIQTNPPIQRRMPRAAITFFSLWIDMNLNWWKKTTHSTTTNEAHPANTKEFHFISFFFSFACLHWLVSWVEEKW